LAPGEILNLHPVAFAAWFGLFATALNLLPLSQLDGGHILYAALGSRQRRLARPLWVVLVAAGFLWPGWWLWSVIVLVFGLRHPPVDDENLPLDRRRRWVAALALLLLVLCFTPVPLQELAVR
jgi:membrane-associated protease RseP (regulator of RpoE activity)